MPTPKIRSLTPASAVLAVAGAAQAQQTSRTSASFISVDQSMWASGARFVNDFA